MYDKWTYKVCYLCLALWKVKFWGGVGSNSLFCHETQLHTFLLRILTKDRHVIEFAPTRQPINETRVESVPLSYFNSATILIKHSHYIMHCALRAIITSKWPMPLKCSGKEMAAVVLSQNLWPELQKGQMCSINRQSKWQSAKIFTFYVNSHLYYIVSKVYVCYKRFWSCLRFLYYIIAKIYTVTLLVLVPFCYMQLTDERFAIIICFYLGGEMM